LITKKERARQLKATQPKFVSIIQNIRIRIKIKINNSQNTRINSSSNRKKINFSNNECTNGRYNKGLKRQGQEEYLNFLKPHQ